MKFKELFLYFKREFTKYDVSALASQVAYSLIFAIFPFMIFLVTLLAFVNIDVNLLLKSVHDALPTQAFETISTTLTEIFTERNTSLLSISILGSIWSASNGIKAIIKSINNAYEVKETRNFIVLVIVSVVGVLILALVILILLAIIVFGGVIIDYLDRTFNLPDLSILILEILSPIVTVVLLTLGFSAAYTFFPNKKVRWRETLIGSLITTILLLIISFGFSFYVNHFSNYSKVYGSIGGVVVLLTWLFLASISIIIGGEVNAFTMKRNNKKLRKKISAK